MYTKPSARTHRINQNLKVEICQIENDLLVASEEEVQNGETTFFNRFADRDIRFAGLAINDPA